MNIGAIQSHKFGFNGKLCSDRVAGEWITGAIEYASRPSKSTKKLKETESFYKTIDAIKKDTGNHVFKITSSFKLGAEVCTEGNWSIEYGNYKKEVPYNYNSLDPVIDVFNRIREFGREYFGIK